MSAHHKEDWITDLNMAKLSLSPQNRPSWSMIRGAEDQGSSNPALFLKCLTVDVPRHYTKVQCAVPVSLKSSTYCSTSINHLWVCSSTQSSGQVSLVALQCTRPRIIESFLAASSKIVCIELIPGYGCHDNPYAFPAATVWMATSRDEMIIYDVQNGAGLKRQARAMFKVAAGVTLMKYVIGQLFVALASGKLAIYSRDVDGVWNVSSPKVVTIGQKAVTCLLVIDDYLTCMSDNSISMLNPSSHEIERVLSLDCEECSVIQDVARAGMGLWISYRNSSLIHLYHLETMDRLQDINISSVVQKSISGNCDYYSGFVSVSCLVTSKGLLWIGTNTGHILTLPLPRLRDGVPQITSRPDISCHSHQGPVRFIIPLYSTVIPTETMPVIRIGPACDKVEVIHETTPMDYINHEVIIKKTINPTLKMAEQARDTASYDELKSKNSASSFSNSSISTESDVFLSKEDLDLAFQIELRERLLQHAKKWKSTPNLMESDTTEDVKVLYGSLMKTCDGPDTTAPLRPIPRARDIRTLAAVGRKCYTRAMRWRRGQSENIDAYVRNNVKPSLRTHAAFVEPKQRSQSLATPADRLVTEVEGPGADTSLTSVSDVDDTFTTPVSQSSFFCDPPASDPPVTVTSPTPTTPADCVHTSPTCERSPRRHGFSKAVMVVCGGDGYCNWSQDTPKLTRNDASIMVWMYKADF